MTASPALSRTCRSSPTSPGGEEEKQNPESKDHDPCARSVTLLYKERLETLNDFFVFLNVALFRFDCMIIKYPFLASRTKSCLV